MNQTSPFYAFKYMFLDNKILNKFFIFFVLIMINLLPQIISNGAEHIGPLKYLGIFFVMSCVSLVAQILYYGYWASCIKCLTEQNQNFLLPMFNFKKDSLLGLKCFAGQLLLGLAVFFAILTIGIILAIIFAVLFHINNITATILGIAVLILFAILFFVASCIYYPSAIRLFATTEEPLAFFNFKEIIRLIKANSDIYYKYVGILILASLLMIILFVIAFIPCAMLTLKYPIIAFSLVFLFIGILGAYINTVSVYAIAKCIR